MAETDLDGRNVLIRFSTAQPRPRREFNNEGREGRRESGDRNSRYQQRERGEYGEARQPREPRQQRERDPDTTLFVGNLPFNVRWQELKDMFNEAGPVEFVDVAIGRDGRPRGFATVRMGNPEAAEAAIAELNGQEVEGRAMNVRRYEARTQ
jgi:RNA recognition motif-containing protein